ncbi:MAG: 2-oxo acid dehydrogenase subunit E2, partial [Planctomyces sp.]
FLPFVASAVCRALSGQFAALNAHANFDSSSGEGEIVRHRAVHLGIATDTDTGLMVPVVRDADKLGVLEIGRHITHVAEAARSKSASREMLMGSTFTISNVGSHAGRFATPVINVPEVAIIAVGRARDGVVVRNGAIAVGKMLPLSLACDHRVIDGAMAALALASIIDMLQNPEQLLGPARA